MPTNFRYFHHKQLALDNGRASCVSAVRGVRGKCHASLYTDVSSMSVPIDDDKMHHPGGPASSVLNSWIENYIGSTLNRKGVQCRQTSTQPDQTFARK